MFGDDDGAPARGDRLGTYEIAEFLGAGGMGRVFRVRDTKLDRDVAIKFLRSELQHDSERLRGFIEEARAASGLNHPNILTVHEIGDHNGVPFIAMEFVEGQTLRERVRAGPLPIRKALDVTLQIAQALEAAHARNIVHRDIKPENVMLRRDGYIKVLDFGLATLRPSSAAGRSTSPSSGEAGTFAGTPGYASPEQLAGLPVDHRSDIFSLGVMLRELSTGTNPIATRRGSAETLKMPTSPVISAEDVTVGLRPDVAAIVARAIAKKPDERYQTMSDLISDLRRASAQAEESSPTFEQPRPLWLGLALATLAFIVLGVLIWQRMNGQSVASSSDYVQITQFSDSVTSPALSADGRTVAFVRGPRTFYGSGQIYVKSLPDGEPVQLTHDELLKMSPLFSPDGSQIAYTVVTQNLTWDTWVVLTRGGEPRPWLTNASGLSWLDNGRLLFSEVVRGTHMRVVTSAGAGDEPRPVYDPSPSEGMAHRSYLSPDGKWVLLSEMNAGVWLPCRLVPYDGKSAGRSVGPDGWCTSAAWSRDGTLMYFSSNAGGRFHIWRQRFPDGTPARVTSGPTEEEGLAVAPDGRSFLTSLGIRQSAVWIHDSRRGEREVSRDGFAFLPSRTRVYPQVFSADGSKLFYLVRRGSIETTASSEAGELWVADLNASHDEALLPGFATIDYDVSPDGQKVVFAALDGARKSHIHLAWLDHRAPPKQLSSVEADSPRFDPGDDGSIYCRVIEGALTFIDRMSTNDGQRERAVPTPVSSFLSISSDGKWLVGHLSTSGAGSNAPIAAFPATGGRARPLCSICDAILWAPRGRYFVLVFASLGFQRGGTYVVRLDPGEVFPRLPDPGILSQADLMALGAAYVGEGFLSLGPDPSVYAFTRETNQRNIYRVPLR